MSAVHRTMHRCFVPPDQWLQQEIRHDSALDHYLRDVLRLKTGDRAIVFDGAGREAEVELQSPGDARRQPAPLRVVEIRHATNEVSIRLTLLQAVPKGDRMDWLVEKATELGVYAIRPVVTERGIVRVKPGEKSNRSDRWQRIAESAARQCGTAWVPEVRPVAGLSDSLADGRQADLFLVGSLDPAARPLRDVVRDRGSLATAALLIGPEGDLTPHELSLARDAGAVPVTFGRRVLRVETAAVYGISILLTECGGGVLP